MLDFSDATFLRNVASNSAYQESSLFHAESFDVVSDAVGARAGVELGDELRLIHSTVAGFRRAETHDVRCGDRAGIGSVPAYRVSRTERRRHARAGAAEWRGGGGESDCRRHGAGDQRKARR